MERTNDPDRPASEPEGVAHWISANWNWFWRCMGHSAVKLGIKSADLDDARANVVLEMLEQDRHNRVRVPLALASKKLVAQRRACSWRRHELVSDAVGCLVSGRDRDAWLEPMSDLRERADALDRIDSLASPEQRSVSRLVMSGGSIDEWAQATGRLPKKATEIVDRARRNLGKMP